MHSYSQLLRTKAMEFSENGVWLSVGTTTRIQGWKLHLSSIQVETIELLHKVLPLLQAIGVPFKIARDEMVLAQLNEGELGASQVGKFMTIYPEDDEQALLLGQQLKHVTAGMHGPLIPSDVRIGDIVYARYGSFNPIIHRDQLGQISSYIYDGEGNLFIDARSVPFVLPKGIVNPFAELMKEEEPLHNQHQLFGPGYRLIDIIKQSAKGNIYQAIDLRSQELVSIKVIKQGKQYCLSDVQGRDIRDRLKYQAGLHKQLHGVIRIPAADDYFEVNGDGYLPIEYIEGMSVESFVYSIFQNRPWHCVEKKEQARILKCLLQLTKQLRLLHREGYIHRDISASNVWIAEDDQVYLIDLELVWHVNSREIPYGNGTPGFISPNQRKRGRPEFADDVYALGCVMILALTGMDPRRILNGDAITIEKLKGLVRGLSDADYKLIERSVNPLPGQRPSLVEIQTMIEAVIEKDVREPISFLHPLLTDTAIEEILMQGVNSLFHDVPATNDGLWLSPKLNSGKNSGELELRRSVHRGVAGTIYLLSKIKRHTTLLIENSDRIQRAAEWCATAEHVADAGMPGLYFGDMGVAVALADAIDSGLIQATKAISLFINTAPAYTTEWLDLTHGIAGQGVGCFYLSGLLSEEIFEEKIKTLATQLINEQQEDGSWITPEGVHGISGETLSGFAHGVAGIVYFLSDYAYRYKDAQAITSVSKAMDWLQNQSYRNEKGQLKWDYSLTQKTPWNWWCHGGPGIALTYLRLYELTGDDKYARIAGEALMTHDEEVVYPNLSQCHGLSGLGEMYLEAFRVLKDDRWLKKAQAIGQTIFQLSHQNDNGIYWMVEDPNFITADLMMGMSGVLHFYLRLLLKGNEMGFPMLLNGIEKKHTHKHMYHLVSEAHS